MNIWKTGPNSPQSCFKYCPFQGSKLLKGCLTNYNKWSNNPLAALALQAISGYDDSVAPAKKEIKGLVANTSVKTVEKYYKFT